MLINCIAACTHLYSTVSQLFEPQVQKNRRFHVPQATFFIPPCIRRPVRGFPSEYRHPVWRAKTRMALLPDGEKISKISLFVLAQLTNVPDGRTDRQTCTGWRHIPRLCIASRGKNCKQFSVECYYITFALRCRKSARMSVSDVVAPYPQDWTFQQYFCTA